MFEIFLFLFRYKIKKNEGNLAFHCRDFFKLKEKCQNKVIDTYFDTFDNVDIGYYFDNDKARYYEDGKEISFFNSYYFCKKIVGLSINNLSLIDKFEIDESLINGIIKYGIDNNKKGKLDINKLLLYPDNLPLRLAKSVLFMSYLTSNNIYDVRYMVYNDKEPQKQRDIISEVVSKARMNKYNLSKFMIRDKVMPEILINNIDFLTYIIENDINNINYLDDSILKNFTDSNWKNVVKAIIKYMKNNDCDIEVIESNYSLIRYLNRDYDFINYIIGIDVDNVKYVDWHNLVSSEVKKIIDNLALKLVRENIEFDCYKFSFNSLFRENYMFMAYLIDKDMSNINKILVTDDNEVSKLVDIYLNKYRKRKFNIKNYLDENGYICSNLASNKYMLSYLIKNDNKVFKYIDFVTLSNSRDVVDVILKEISNKTFEFDNKNFIINGKYPIILSNSFGFMKYVIDKNFNNLAYMDISMIDNDTLRKIINYAFRMVYYIRGNNKSLNFDLDGYFYNSDIVNNSYFQECLKSLG